MITKLLILDIAVSETVIRTLEKIKKSDVLIVRYNYNDFISNDQNKLADHLVKLIREKMEMYSINTSHICFFNDIQHKTPMVSSQYNNEEHLISDISSNKGNLSSWDFMKQIIRDINLTTAIETFDFIDINHLCYPNQYEIIFEYIKTEVTNFPNVSLNYIKVPEDNDELYKSANLMHGLCTMFYNGTNKQIIDQYFTINNVNINYLNSVPSPIQNKPTRKNLILHDINTNEINMCVIPLYGYTCDQHYNCLNNYITSLKDDTIVEYIYPSDSEEIFFSRLINTLERVCGTEKSNIRSMKLGVWLNPTFANPDLGLSNLFDAKITTTISNIISEENQNNSQILKEHFIVKINECLVDFFSLNELEFEIFNVSKSRDEKLNKFYDFLHNKYFDTTRVNFNYSIYDFIGDIAPVFDMDYEYNETDSGILQVTNNTYINKSFQNESSKNTLYSYLKEEVNCGEFLLINGTVSNVILFDHSLIDYLPEIQANTLSDTTVIVTFYNDDTFEEIKTYLRELNRHNGINFTNVALFQDNIGRKKYYNFVNEESSLIESLEYRDPEIQTWNKYQNFVTFMENEMGVQYFDLLLCKIDSNINWKYAIDKISSGLDFLQIRSSENITGHTMFDGDWVLESPDTDVNLINLYFSESIKNVEIKLGSMIDGVYVFDDNTELSDAVAAWFTDNTSAISTYGNIDQWDVGNVTDMDELFSNENTFNDDITNWNVSNVTSMYRMFYRARSFNQDIGGWNVSNVTSMKAMFADADVFNQDLNDWDVTNVNNMGQMFDGAHDFNGAIGNWNVSNVTNLIYMFRNCDDFDNDISNWNVSNNINFGYMFQSAKLFNGNIGSWQMGNAKSTDSMFKYAYVFQQDLSNWDVGNVTSMREMFLGASQFNQPLNSWNVQNVKNFPSMFESSAYNQPLNDWNMSSAVLLEGMFRYNSVFNQDITGWNVSNVTQFRYMFSNTGAFNYNLSPWNVKPTASLYQMFKNASSYNNIELTGSWQNHTGFKDQMFDGTTNSSIPIDLSYDTINGFNSDNLSIAINAWSTQSEAIMAALPVDVSHISNWNVGNVTSMQDLFASNGDFNEDIGGWNVSKVTNMLRIFRFASSFNQDISQWNVANVTSFTYAFNGATAFNQDLDAWKIQPDADLQYMFSNASSFSQTFDSSSWYRHTGNTTGMFLNITASINVPLSFSNLTLSTSSGVSSGTTSTKGKLNISLNISTSYLDVQESHLVVVNGVISNFIKSSNSVYTFDLASSTIGSLTSVSIAQDTIKNEKSTEMHGQDTNFNENSNVFEWTWQYTPVRPDITIYSTDISSSFSYPNSSINMIMDISDNSTSENDQVSTFTSFDISGENGYVFDISAISQSKIAFKLGSSSITDPTTLYFSQDTIPLTINSGYTVALNNASNVFTWSYNSPDLTVSSLVINDENTVTITNGANTGSTNLWLQFTFSESIFNFNSSFLTFTNCIIANISSDDTFTIFTVKTETLAPASASVTLKTDLLITTGRGLQKFITGPNNLSFNWNYDNTRPSISIISSQASGSTTNFDIWDLSFVSTMDTSDFDINAITLTGDYLVTSFSGSGQNYYMRLNTNRTPMAPTIATTLTVSIAESAFTDSVYGNSNESSSTLVFYFDNIPPTITITSPDISSGHSSSDSYITLNFNMSKPVDDFSLEDLELDNGVLGVITKVSSSLYTAALYPIQIDTVSVYISSGSVTDNAGNVNVSNSNEFEWIFSSNDFLITLSSADVSNNGSYASDSVSITLTSNTSLNAFVDTDIACTNGTISNVNASAKTFDITSINPNVSTSVYIIGGAVASGTQTNVESNTFTWTYDPPIPTLLIESFQVDNGDYSNLSQVDFTLTFNNDAVVFDETNLDITNGSLLAFTGSGSTYQTSITPSSDGNVVVSMLENEASVSNNGITYTNDVSYNFEWNHDTISADISINSSFIQKDASSSLTEVTLDITSSKHVIGLSISDFDVSNALLSNLSDTSGTSFTVKLQPLDEIADCSVNICLKAGAVLDRAGNPNNKSVDFSYSYVYFSRKLESSAIVSLFENDTTIPVNERLSSSEIDLVLSAALTIPDTTSPFATSVTSVKPPKITIPSEINIVNRKVFTRLVDQIFASASSSVTSLTIDKSSMVVSAAAVDELAEIEEVVMVKSNQTEPIDMSSFTDDSSEPSAAYIALVNAGDFVIVTLDNIEYTTVANGDDTFTLSDPNGTIGTYGVNDVYSVSGDRYKIIFGSETIVDSGEPPVSSDSSSSSAIPCFLKGTEILTTCGYKKIEELTPMKDKLLDKDNKVIPLLDIQKYKQKNNGDQYPKMIPGGTHLSNKFICTKDLFLTHNHCIYLPQTNQYAPVSCMKNIKNYTGFKQDEFTYYHIYSENYFSDTIIANGIPCETHGKYIFKKLYELDNTGTLTKQVLKKVDMRPNCMRKHMTKHKFNKLIRKHKTKHNFNKQIRKKK